MGYPLTLAELVDGVKVGERGGLSFHDYKTNKSFRGWRAVSEAVTY